MPNYEPIRTQPGPMAVTDRPASGGMATWYLGSISGYTHSSLSAGVDHRIAEVHYTVPGGGAVYLTGQLSSTTPADVYAWCGDPVFATGASHPTHSTVPFVEAMQVGTWSVFTNVPGGTYVSYLYAKDTSNSFSVSRVSLLALVAGTGTVTGDPSVFFDGTESETYYPYYWFDSDL